MKKMLFLIFLLFLLTMAAWSEAEPGVLQPENSNEARLNNLQPPEQVLRIIGVHPGLVVAEIGAGNGRYAVQLAVRVGPGGRVYAEDIDGEALAHLEKRCRRWGLKNVTAVKGEVTDPKLPSGRLDLIWVVSSYHHFDDPVALLRTARAALKPDGRLAIGEWMSIHEAGREGSSPETIASQMKAAGFILERVDRTFEKNNFLIHLFRRDGTH
jgi:SAM-dependent methyltransferase